MFLLFQVVLTAWTYFFVDFYVFPVLWFFNNLLLVIVSHINRTTWLLFMLLLIVVMFESRNFFWIERLIPMQELWTDSLLFTSHVRSLGLKWLSYSWNMELPLKQQQNQDWPLFMWLLSWDAWTSWFTWFKMEPVLMSRLWEERLLFIWLPEQIKQTSFVFFFEMGQM